MVFLKFAGSVLVVLVLSQCGEKAPERGQLEGAWVLVDGVYTRSNGETVNMKAGNHSEHIKIITDSHFSTLWQDSLNANNIGFNGGPYSYEDGIYTEYVQYHSAPSARGDSAFFRIDLIGALMTMKSCKANGEINNSGYFQAWEKVE